MYLLAILLPPLTVLLYGKPSQAMLNVLLTILGWVPGVIHAIIVVKHHKEHERTKALFEDIKSVNNRVRPPRP